LAIGMSLVLPGLMFPDLLNTCFMLITVNMLFLGTAAD